MLQRIVYSQFAHSGLKLDELDQAPLEPYPTRPDSQFRWKIVFSEHATQAVVEDWFKGHDIEWTYFVDAHLLRHLRRGRADPVAAAQLDREARRHVPPRGCLPLPARGARHLQDDEREPFRHLVFDVPNPGYDADELAAGTAERSGS